MVTVEMCQSSVWGANGAALSVLSGEDACPPAAGVCVCVLDRFLLLSSLFTQESCKMLKEALTSSAAASGTMVNVKSVLAGPGVFLSLSARYARAAAKQQQVWLNKLHAGSSLRQRMAKDTRITTQIRRAGF